MQRGKILAAGCSLLWACSAPAETPDREMSTVVNWAEAAPRIRDRLLARISAGALARDDGFIYTVDVAQAMEAAALLDDRAAYVALLEVANAARVDAGSDAFRRGFVAWRSKAGETFDATGTTEALRLARALWEGAERFARPADRRWALEIMEGYRRHEYVDQGVWLIRNYYNLGTNAFATNSFLVDYDPDFTRRVARAEPAFVPLADAVDALVESAITELGFVHELVQPEILTALPHLGTATFSPDRLSQLSNSCAVLERSLGRHRASAAKLLRFAHAQAEDLRLIYDVETGRPHPRGFPGVETYGCLTRLAQALGEPQLARPFAPKLIWFIRDLLENEPQPFAFVASELLLTAAHAGREYPE